MNNFLLYNGIQFDLSLEQGSMKVYKNNNNQLLVVSNDTYFFVDCDTKETDLFQADLESVVHLIDEE